MSLLGDLFGFHLTRFIAAVIETVIEIIGLVFWLSLQLGGNILGAAVTLFVFLIVEHIVSQVTFDRSTGQSTTAAVVARLAGFTLFEVFVWVVWLALIPVNGIIAFVIFLLGLFVEHRITYNVLRRLGFLQFGGSPGEVYIGIAIFTVLEVGGAVIWVSVVPPLLIAMIVGSLIEHYMAGNVAHIP